MDRPRKNWNTKTIEIDKKKSKNLEEMRLLSKNEKGRKKQVK